MNERNFFCTILFRKLKNKNKSFLLAVVCYFSRTCTSKKLKNNLFFNSQVLRNYLNDLAMSVLQP